MTNINKSTSFRKMCASMSDYVRKMCVIAIEKLRKMCYTIYNHAEGSDLLEA